MKTQKTKRLTPKKIMKMWVPLFIDNFFGQPAIQKSFRDKKTLKLFIETFQVMGTVMLRQIYERAKRLHEHMGKSMPLRCKTFVVTVEVRLNGHLVATQKNVILSPGLFAAEIKARQVALMPFNALLDSGVARAKVVKADMIKAYGVYFTEIH